MFARLGYFQLSRCGSVCVGGNGAREQVNVPPAEQAQFPEKEVPAHDICLRDFTTLRLKEVPSGHTH